MTDVTWIWIGNKPMLDSSPNSNITDTQANAAVGWTASGSDEMKVVDVTGPSRGDGWQTTYQRGTDEFSYDRPTGGSTNDAEIVTFMYADFEIEIQNANGERETITRRGIVMQADNGDVFIRPAESTLHTWSGINIIYSIKIVNVDTIRDSTEMAKVSFNPDIKDVVIPPCFTPGTLIETARGQVAVETLRVGDLVWTQDAGFQAITWIGGRKLSAIELELWPNLRPVRIAAGALGNSTPERDLVVSPQHRIFIRSSIAERMFGHIEVLVGAKHLIGLPGIEIAEDVAEVEYIHFLLGQHAVVRSNGAKTESLFPGPQAMKGIPPQARAEVLMLFPELAGDGAQLPEPARFFPKGKMARQLAERHARNRRELVS